jgi:predicted transcriptional regulator
MTGKRRSGFEIKADILLALSKQFGEKLKPTHVMYQANLSHKLLKEYLDDLVFQGLIESKGDGKKFIHLTVKGKDFLRQFRDFKEFRDTFGI